MHVLLRYPLPIARNDIESVTQRRDALRELPSMRSIAGTASSRQPAGAINYKHGPPII
jgi:hypothetical protein